MRFTSNQSMGEIRHHHIQVPLAAKIDLTQPMNECQWVKDPECWQGWSFDPMTSHTVVQPPMPTGQRLLITYFIYKMR